MKKKLAAFTLIELVIGLIISSIVVMMAGSAFNIVKMQFANYKITNDRVQECKTIDYLLKKDMDECRYATVIESGITLQMQKDEITYKWSKDKLFRKATQHVDTFALSVQSVETKFQNIPVISGMIDHLHLKLKQGEEFFDIYLSKQYSAEELMQTRNKEDDL